MQTAAVFQDTYLLSLPFESTVSISYRRNYIRLYSIILNLSEAVALFSNYIPQIGECRVRPWHAESATDDQSNSTTDYSLPYTFLTIL